MYTPSPFVFCSFTQTKGDGWYMKINHFISKVESFSSIISNFGKTSCCE